MTTPHQQTDLEPGLRYEWSRTERAKQPLRCRFDQNVTNPLQTTSGVTTKGGIEFAGQNGYPQRAVISVERNLARGSEPPTL